jgi:hypothetical protein
VEKIKEWLARRSEIAARVRTAGRMFNTMRAAQLAILATTALAQTQYGENQIRPISFDSQLVEQKAFPAPNATLLSPAFLKSGNASFDPGWFTGSEGATSQDELSVNFFLQNHHNS